MNTINTNVNGEQKELSHNKILPFPLLKRYSKDQITNDELSKSDIEDIAKHYTTQIVHQLGNMGFSLDASMMNDAKFLHSTLASIMCRSAGKYHKLHDTMDNILENK